MFHCRQTVVDIQLKTVFCIFLNCTLGERAISAPVSLLSLQFLKHAVRRDSFSETKQPQLVTSGTIEDQVNMEGFLGH